MNRILEETEELLAMRRCHDCGNETPLYIARIANEKGQVIGTDSRTPICDHCGAAGWEYNPQTVKYPKGKADWDKKRRETNGNTDI